jgi:preprotein translocase subunit SecG
MHFILFRSLCVAAGLTFLLSTQAPPDVIPARTVLIFVAAPFLLFSWLPRFFAAGLTEGFLTSYSAILAPLTLLMSLIIGVFTYEKSSAVIYLLQLIMATSVCVTGIVMLRKSPSSNHSGIAGGVMLGLAYLPIVVLSLMYRSKERRPEDLYRPTACALQYHTLHEAWAPTLREAAFLQGCKGIERGIDYKPSPSGFSMHTTGRAPVYYADESGILRIDGPSGFPVKNYADIVSIIVFQLNEYRQKEREYPPSLETVPRLNTFLKGQEGLSLWYQIAYDRESPAGFHINARPTRYGVSGLRSYYADQTGSIHATPLDRAATSNDPQIPEREARGL